MKVMTPEISLIERKVVRFTMSLQIALTSNIPLMNPKILIKRCIFKPICHLNSEFLFIY